MICLALTNIHIRFNPLRATDGTFYRRMRTHICEIGVGVARKRRMTQQIYRERRHVRVNMQFRANEARVGHESLTGREMEQDF